MRLLLLSHLLVISGLQPVDEGRWCTGLHQASLTSICTFLKRQLITRHAGHATISMIEVRSAGIKGLGVFASRPIARSTRIFAEQPLFGLRHDQGQKHIYPAFKALTETDKMTVTALSAHATNELGVLRWMHVIWYTISSATIPRMSSLRHHRKLLDIFRSNAFSLNDNSIFYRAIFPRIARLNHECVPNAQANFNDKAEAMHVHAIRDIEPDEEVTLSYLDDAGEMTRAQRQDKLTSYGFECGCPVCDSKNPRAAESVKRRDAIHEVMRSLHESQSSHTGSPSRVHELQALLTIMDLMQAEGLVGRELAARYAVAAKWYEELGDIKKAVESSSRGLEIDEYALGTDHGTYLANKVESERLQSISRDQNDEAAPRLHAAHG